MILSSLGNNRIMKAVAPVMLRTAGAVTPRIGGAAKWRDEAFTAAKNISNPNVNFAGTPNPAPQTAVKGADSGWVAPMANPNVPTTGLYDGGGSYDANKDPARIQSARTDVGNLMGVFEQAFQAAMGEIDTLAAQKKDEYAKKYQTAKDSLSSNYVDTSRQIDNQMSGRGALNSSYQATEQGTAQKAFDDAFQGLISSENADMASVGQFADTQKAELNASRPGYNLNDYNDAGDLLDIKQSVQDAIGKLNVTRAGLGTDSQYISKLNSITPATADAGNAALKAQLDKLALTNANPEAKRFVAQQTISDAGGDPKTFMDYFEGQLSATGANPNPDQALVIQ